MLPAVLVISYGGVKSDEIVQNILSNFKNTSNRADTKLLNHVTYNCCVTTKYYDTNISLIPWDKECDIPVDILNTVEAIVVYFNSEDKTLLSSLEKVNNVLKKANNIELGVLITDQFSKKSVISFEELKNELDFDFDIVMLRNGEEIRDKDNYDKVVEALRNQLWSNVKIGPFDHPRILSDSSKIEEDLNTFEHLLSSAQNLKKNTHSTREELFDQAEKFAKMLSTIIDESDSE